MTFLPGIELVKEQLDNQTQYRFYLAILSLVIILESLLLAFCLVTMYRVLWQHSMWRSSILLTFYMFATLAISTRLIASFAKYSMSPTIVILMAVEPIA